ncbi:hypothetical protein [Nostoc sp.]|uniref:hypothetical protein n=1 Tax=Nostoc sp. TaxID=1180 RepID=UPI002FFA1B69
MGNLKGIFRTYCFCQASENSELIVKVSSTHPRKLAKVLPIKVIMKDYFENFKFFTLVGLLCQRALYHPDKLAFTFLQDGETESSSFTYQQLDQQARSRFKNTSHK